MNRLILTMAVGLLAVLAGCGPRDSGSLGEVPTGGPTSPAPSASPTAEPTESPQSSPPAEDPGNGDAGPAPSGRTTTIQLWFTKENRLFPTMRTRPHTVATSQLALTELAAGPSASEREAGLGNGIPSDLDFTVTISEGVATLDAPASFYAGGGDVARLRQAQVVYTLTQFSTVSKVGFQQGGEPGGWPVGRSDYADLLPPIVVTGPTIGQRVSSPVTVTGNADVFESTVSVRILDAGGAEIANTFTTAAGRRGDYTVDVRYDVASEQPGTVQVYSVSPEDGSREHAVDIPVTLAP
jgi:hypothetical protein